MDTARPARLSFPALIGFATPGFAIGALSVAIGVYLPNYYAAQLGLPLAVVGAAFGMVRLFDSVLDPVLGALMDQSRTRLGRYRPWLMAGAPVLMVAVFMLFDPPAGATKLYLFGWLALYYLGLSLSVLSHVSWASGIAGQYNERSRLFGAIQFIAVVGATLILLPPILLAKAGGARAAVPPMGWGIVLAVPVGALLAILSAREPIAASTHEDRLSWRDYVAILSRADVLRIAVADFCLTLGPGWMSALYLFYFHDLRGFSLASASSLLGLYIAAGLFGAPAFSWLAIRIGKHRALMVASTAYSLGLLLLPLIPRGAYPLAALSMVFQGFLAASFAMLDRAMMGDVGDAIRLEQGKRRVGLLFAMITTAQKFGTAFSITLSYAALGWVGYQARHDVVNTPAAIAGLQWVYLTGPIVFVMLGGACFIGWRLDSTRHARILADLETRDALEASAA